MIKLRRLIWMRRVSVMGDIRNAYKVLVGNFENRDELRDTDVDERILLKLILQKQYEN
jgi:hypothetical protein